MSSGNSYPRCAIDVRPSRALFLYSFLLTIAALLAPWLCNISFPAALACNLATIPAAAGMKRWARGELQRIAWQSDGRWLLLDRKGREHDDARLLPGVFIGSRLLALHWRCDACGRRFRAALLAGNSDDDDRRRLGVRLRLTPDEELFRKATG